MFRPALGTGLLPSSHPGQMPGNGITGMITAEQMSQLLQVDKRNHSFKTAQKKKAMGATEESDPEYAKLMHMLR